MNKEKILKQKIGLYLTGTGNLSKVLAVQTFTANNLEITPEQFTVLAVLYENDGLYQRQISAMTLKDRPNISRIITILEGMGYITKTPDVNGRKIFKIAITDKGRLAYQKTLPIITSVWHQTIEDIDEDDLKVFDSVLKQIRENLLSKVNIQI